MTELDLVLPVAARDARRARLCVQSFAARFRDHGTLWLIVPDDAADAFSWADAHAFVRRVPESDLVGPISLLHRLTGLSGAGRSGWYRQQLIKLAAARLVGTPYYLTLDADVLCTQAVSAGDLFRGELALCVHHEMCHPTWYRVAAHLLELPMLKGEYGVTPVLLHRESTLSLLDHLEARSRDLGRWIGWTEYALYFTYLEGKGELDRLYRRVSFETWFGPCAWSSWTVGDPAFSPAAAFSPRSGGWFSLVSSKCQVPILALERMIVPYLER